MLDEKRKQIKKKWERHYQNTKVFLDKILHAKRITEAEEYIEVSFAFFTETIESLVESEDRGLYKDVFILLIETQDLLRGSLVCQKEGLLATSAINLRTVFEISCNLEYIFKDEEPEELIVRMKDFLEYEKLVGIRHSRFFDTEEKQEKEFALKHPYWRSKKTGLLKVNQCWNGRGLSLKQIAERIGRGSDYDDIYRQSSKFAHGSPLVKNAYRGKKGINFCGPIYNITYFNMLCCKFAMETLANFCRFFEQPFDTNEFRWVQTGMLDVQNALKELGDR